MGFFDKLFNRNAERFFAPGEMQRITETIQEAERQTSGEIRVFIESRCTYVDPVHRAAELFFGYKMDLTAQRNGVLVYVAMRDHQYAIFADEGIYKEMGSTYWNTEAGKMLAAFKTESYADGLVTVISDIGEALRQHFPFDSRTDKNELPDDIIFGK